MLLIVIAYLDENERRENVELANALNFQFDYPQYLIQATIQDLTAQSSAPAREEAVPIDADAPWDNAVGSTLRIVSYCRSAIPTAIGHNFGGFQLQIVENS